MPERFDDLAVTVTAPAGWHVRVSKEPRFVALVPDAQRGERADGLVGALLIEPAPDGDLDMASRAAMKRYVPEGWPDYARVFVQGRHAHRYQWTDGVRNIASWFVAAGTAAELDHDARHSDHVRVVFAFSSSLQDPPVVEITCDAAVAELTVGVSSS